jgi:O-methyltransferase involved in polyketide biosynthesis
VNQIITLLQSLEVTQWAGVALLGLLAYLNRDAVKPLVVKLQKAFAKGTGATDAKPDRSTEAFEAVKVLLAHFEATKCEAGAKAAREAGSHLFDKPGEVH